MDGKTKLAKYRAIAIHQARLLKALPDALAASKEGARQRRLGQNSLFGDASEAVSDLPLPEVGPSEVPSLMELAQNEHAALGMHLSVSPYELFAWPKEQYTVVSSTELAALPKDTPVIVGGLITQVKPWLDRKKKTMAFVQLVDGEGAFEAVVFSSTYQENLEIVTVDKAVLIDGKTDGATAKIVVQRIKEVKLL